MEKKFRHIKQFIYDMNMDIVREDPVENIAVVDDEENGIKNLIIDCEDSIIIMEQLIMKVPIQKNEFYKILLQMNRNLVHGAFVIDEKEENVIFRDTLQLENLDRNELEGSIHALSLALSEFGNTLLSYSDN